MVKDIHYEMKRRQFDSEYSMRFIAHVLIQENKHVKLS